MSITMEGDASLPNYEYIKHYKKNVTTVTDRDLPLFNYPSFSMVCYIICQFL